jgi:sulfur-carrier protein adenylyltransferase/sulfurtransferase
MFNSQETEYYSRQITLQDFSYESQLKLKEATVVIVGAGGLGCPVLLYLAGAGIGNMIIIDGDNIQMNNLHRQILYDTDNIGKNKALTAKEKLEKLNPNIQIDAFPSNLTQANIEIFLKNADLVIDATDNFETRFLLGDYAAKLNLPLIFAAIYGFEGQITVFNFKDGPALRDLFPEIPDSDSFPDCAVNGVIGFVPGILGCLQAAEAIKIITGIGTVMSGKLLVFDFLTMNKTELKIKYPRVLENNDQINYHAAELTRYKMKLLFHSQQAAGIQPLRSPGYALDHSDNSERPDNFISQYYSLTDLKNEKMTGEINILQLEERFESVFILDVREPYEFNNYNIGGTLIPLRDLPGRLSEIPADKDIVVVCESGIRSANAANYIASVYTETNVFNLKGGLKVLKKR